VDWIHLAKDTDQWRTLMNTITNILVALETGNFWN